MIRYGYIVWHDHMNGPGTRLSIWVSGCPHKCPGCFNQELWENESGKPLTPDIEWRIEEAMKNGIDGITLLGGEPLAPHNYEWSLNICKKAKELGLDVVVYTGYKWEQVPYELDKYVDWYVDGMYIEKLHCNHPCKGSSNQRVLKKMTNDNYFMEVETFYEDSGNS